VRGDAASENPGKKAEPRGGTDSARGGTRDALSADWEQDVPLEVTVDSSRLTVTDDGDAVRVVYPSGRKRVFFTDGEERELDEGDGPARVVSTRKSPDRVVVTSKWPSKNALAETWELRAAEPRRLTITTKVSGRRSFRYTRTYEPGVPYTPTPTPTATPTEAPTPTPAPLPPGATAPPSGMPGCSIRPPRGASAEELKRLARVSSADAEKRALASVPPGRRVSSVISSDVEVNEGCLVYPFDLRIEGKKGVQEVLVDAGDGRVLSSKFEEN
jgi:hypothetical protein